MGAYITILDDGKKLRLRVLPGQKGPFGKKLDISKNIQGRRDIREMYDPGTILYASSLVDTGRGFYRADGVRHATKNEAIHYENMWLKIKGFKDQELNVFDVV